MGSLPNLSDLGRDHHPSSLGISQNKPNSMSGQQSRDLGLLSFEEKNRILHRHSAYNSRNAAAAAEPPPPVPPHGHVCDDVILEHMAAYSPVSARSTRNSHSVKRKDSLTSSIGATSVRRLIAVVRNTSGKCGPIYTRRILIKNLVLFCISHVLLTSTLLPFLALQSSVSIWVLPYESSGFPPISVNTGAFLLMTLHLFASISSILAPFFLRKFGNKALLVFSYFVFALFYLVHVYPALYVLLPAYIVFGASLGPLFITRASFLMTVSTKLSYVYTEDDEEAKFARKTCLLRRVTRAFQTAHDFGFIAGSIYSALIINYSFRFGDSFGNLTTMNLTTNETLERYDDLLNGIFDVDEFGDRLCGSQACPSNFQFKPNVTDFYIVPNSTATVLIATYAILAFLGWLLIAFLNKIKIFVYQDPLERSEGWTAIRAVKETFKDFRLQLSAPLALFIGLEQSFMYADFSKSYVVCTLGIQRVNFVFLCMGLLQSVAAFTLSMLMRSVKRYYLIGVGFAFQCCLLLVQMLWKPINDDPALFYVISAAWGVCNAIWEMLNYTFVTGLYMDNFEAAYANSTFFKLLGLAVGFGVHGLLCNWIKVYALAFFLLLAVVPSLWLEIKLENAKRLRSVSRL